jgi:hypothetical protein
MGGLMFNYGNRSPRYRIIIYGEWGPMFPDLFLRSEDAEKFAIGWLRDGTDDIVMLHKEG